MLDHLTHQHWSYQPPSAHQRIDLLVVADGVQPTCSLAPGHQAQAVLRLGSASADGHGYLSWPLKADALEIELNRLGGLTIRQGNTQHPQVLFSTAATGAALASADTTLSLMRLQQWPPSKLLAGAGRMRLATLLTGKAMSLDELARRSAFPLDICKAFVDDLQRAQLLLSVGVTPAAVPTSKSALQQSAPLPRVVQPGLLDRIRMRLGIKSANTL